jgi:hypothetical protein
MNFLALVLLGASVVSLEPGCMTTAAPMVHREAKKVGPDQELCYTVDSSDIAGHYCLRYEGP